MNRIRFLRTETANNNNNNNNNNNDNDDMGAIVQMLMRRGRKPLPPISDDVYSQVPEQDASYCRDSFVVDDDHEPTVYEDGDDDYDDDDDDDDDNDDDNDDVFIIPAAPSRREPTNQRDAATTRQRPKKRGRKGLKRLRVLVEEDDDEDVEVDENVNVNNHKGSSSSSTSIICLSPYGLSSTTASNKANTSAYTVVPNRMTLSAAHKKSRLMSLLGESDTLNTSGSNNNKASTPFKPVRPLSAIDSNIVRPATAYDAFSSSMQQKTTSNTTGAGGRSVATVAPVVCNDDDDDDDDDDVDAYIRNFAFDTLMPSSSSSEQTAPATAKTAAPTIDHNNVRKPQVDAVTSRSEEWLVVGAMSSMSVKLRDELVGSWRPERLLFLAASHNPMCSFVLSQRACVITYTWEGKARLFLLHIGIVEKTT